ncbi:MULTISPECIES: iron-containing alcohol dehydrogenase [Kitasatospora]|uniref:Alcohol dehydrogenase iron-type/glycerol dehydrogenase GldA domain-containing protein n=1 Tax=Kitasatospora setae (strain ATCC 33774 / DSM 43861 / JCM 3304 / KCC A-0304 / NBRC 14216 / KM-6054) TaxID=452652 RepID=E4ND71_KITSK|nr:MULTISPECIES: iron-containing alcohol dehydrogenase [Kitasatospora]BAJ29152.1 hypothetical protein KSE_33420 [Kitasatospora setae KM-6054]
MPPTHDRIRVIEGLDRLGPIGRTDLVVTSPRAWAAAAPLLGAGAARIETGPAPVPDAGTTRILAVGAGAVMDRAKVAAADAGLPLLTVPTLLSTDAAFSPVAALRVGDAVEYRETGLPDAVVLDRALLAAAPPAGHRWSTGDLLSVESAVRDRLLAHQVDEPLLRTARDLVDRTLAGLHDEAPDPSGTAALLIAKVEAGLRTGDAWFEEGTEHYLAYQLEQETDAVPWHGELLLALMPVCAVLQEWAPERSARIADALRRRGLDRPGARLLPAVDFRRLLAGAPGYCAAHGLTNTVLLHRPPTAARSEAAVAAWEGGW